MVTLYSNYNFDVLLHLQTVSLSSLKPVFVCVDDV